MTFHPAWEKFHAEHHQIFGRFPTFERLMDIFVAEIGSVLELGCGVGMNIPYFSHREADYYGIDGSDSAVKSLLERYPALSGRVSVGDFTRELSLVPNGYDVICERASIPHNDIASIRRCLDLVYGALKPGGIFISSDWFSSWHSEFVRGSKLGQGTREDYPDGQFLGIGKVHFSDELELVDLFGKFEGIHLEERVVRRLAPNNLVKEVVQFRYMSRAFDSVDYRSCVWDIVVRKPK